MHQPRRRLIMIVEDEPDLAALLRDVLREDGYEVVLSTAGAAAQRLEETRPALVILDYSMPVLSGAEVMEAIRHRAETVPPIILITGHMEAASLAQQLGADAYLRKPFNMEDLLGLTKDLLP